jgi:hypothetical protein
MRRLGLVQEQEKTLYCNEFQRVVIQIKVI